MTKERQGPTQRQLRVAEEIRHVLARVFGRGEIRDPELAGEAITVTEVRIGPDLKHATAFVSRLGRSDIDALLPALNLSRPDPGVTVRELPQTPPGRDLWCLQPTGRRLPAAQPMVDALTRAAERFQRARR